MDVGSQLAALADPTRRAIFELVRSDPRPVTDLADEVPVSRPAVSQHLKVLADAGLVRARADGTRRIYAVDLDGLAALRRWVEGHWDDVLDSFERAARKDQQ